MTTTETQAPLAQLAAAVRKLHAAGWTYNPARGEYRRGNHTLEPEILSTGWTSLVLYRDDQDRPGRFVVARLGWCPDETDVPELVTLIGCLS